MDSRKVSDPRGEESWAIESISPARRKLLTVAVICGAFISVMDVSVVNVSLPHMRGTFGADLSAITWVATSYSIAQIIMITMTGWWSTVLGRKRFYLLSFAIFTIGSALAGTSHSFTEMVIYRVLQGIGGGPLIPLSQAILRESYPPRQQGMAMAIFGMGVVLAPALGPVVGGWLTDEYGWPWVFYINIPVSLVGIFLVNLYVQDPPYLKRGIKQVDWGGIFFLGVGLIGLQIFLERGQEENWFDSMWITVCAAVTVVALVILVLWELRAPEPIVDVRLLRNSALSIGSSIILIFGVALFGTTFILPQFLQNTLDFTAYDAGMILFPRGVALFIVLPIIGRLFNFVDIRFILVFGTGVILYSLHLLSHLTLDAGFWNFVVPLIFMGMGMPCIFVTLSTVSLGSVRPAQATAASSIFNLARRVGGNIGFALLATLIERRSAVHRVGLVGYVSDLNDAFVRYKANLVSLLVRREVDTPTAHTKALALIDQLVDRQAAMLAYNDTFWFMAVLFAAILPLILFLPGRLRGR